MSMSTESADSADARARTRLGAEFALRSFEVEEDHRWNCLVELFSFVRFHVRAGTVRAAEEALRNVLSASRQEPGCLRMHLYRSTRDPRLFYIHSQWVNEEAFDQHASLPHTLHFLELMESLIDQPRDVARTELIA